MLDISHTNSLAGYRTVCNRLYQAFERLGQRMRGQPPAQMWLHEYSVQRDTLVRFIHLYERQIFDGTPRPLEVRGRGRLTLNYDIHPPSGIRREQLLYRQAYQQALEQLRALRNILAREDSTINLRAVATIAMLRDEAIDAMRELEAQL